MFSLFKWESIDDFRPAKGNLKHVPESEHKALAWAIAQKENNALAALKWTKQKPLTMRRRQARAHTINISWCLRANHSDLLDCVSKSTLMSKLELLSSETQRAIIRKIDYVDRHCLALTSKAMLKTVTLSIEHDWGDDEICRYPELADWRRLEDWNHDAASGYTELMQRLKDWMPTDREYCHHCLIRLPGHSFGPSRSVISDIICMDCRYNTSRKLQPGWWVARPCHGCLVTETVVDDLMEEYPTLQEDQIWDEINGLSIEASTHLASMM